MVKVNSVTAEGFGSLIKQITFQLDLEGLNIIRGRVGSGKTSIPSSLYWGFYGKSLKKGSSIETWEELRTKEYKGTMVRIDFNIGKNHYQIIRCISYKGKIMPASYKGKNPNGGSGLWLIVNGERDTEKNKIVIQKKIIDILGYSPELFINSIIYGQRLKRIIEESGPNKKKLFDEAFETMFIDKAKNKAEAERKDLESLLRTNRTKEESKVQSLEKLSRAYDDMVSYEESFEKDKKKKLKELKEEIVEYEESKNKTIAKLKKIPSTNTSHLEDGLDEVELKYHKAQEEIDKFDSIETNMSKVTQEMEENRGKRATLVISKECPSCSQPLEYGKRTKLVETYKEEYAQLASANKKLEKLRDAIDYKKLNKKLAKLKEQRKEIKTSILSIKSNVELKNTLESHIREYERKQKKATDKWDKINDSVLEKKSDEHQINIITLRESISVVSQYSIALEKELDLYNWLIKDPLSNSGIKAYIFNSLLSKVNDNLTRYSEILGFRVEFGIDMGTAAKDFYQVIYKDDIIINYPDLSGGQKQLVDTAIALAIHEVIASVRPINILFLDEPFEGLDNDTIDVISDIISYKAQGRSLYLITHHSSFNPTNSNTIYFSLDKNSATEIN